MTPAVGSAASAAVRDPATSPETLAQIAYQYPELREQVVWHPSTYPGLLQWLNDLNDPRICASVEARRAGLKPPDVAPQASGQQQSQRRSTDIEITAPGHGLIRLHDDQQVTIGRSPNCDIQINHPSLSSRHAVVRNTGGQWVIEDLKSTNGTWIDGKRITIADLDDDTTVTLGDPINGAPVYLRPAIVLAHTTTFGPSSPIDVNPSATATAAVYVGRDPDNAYYIADPLASRKHASITVEANGTIVLTDLHSRNGTQVNGQPIRRVVLCEGDVVTIGNTDLVLHGDDLVPRELTATASNDLIVRDVDYRVENGARLLHGIDLEAASGTLTALIGPSGAGKSTLGRLLTGITSPSAGTVTFAGHDLHAEYAALRSRIGFVPQDDVVHQKLTVRQALEYAAELRLPADTDRATRCNEVMAELGLTERADLRIEKLSGGQRKRVSVAIELITSPTLLVLDEPTSGLDPALDRQVMELLVRLAKGGRIVIVVTHSLAYLHLVDQVLLLAPGGLPTYCGAPDNIQTAFGTSDWADVFDDVVENPQDWWQKYLARVGKTPASLDGPPAPNLVQPLPPVPREVQRQEATRQMRTLIRRQVRLLISDRSYSAFLAALPVVLGLLALVVPGHAGFGPPPILDPGERPSTEPTQLLVLMILGACFMGASLSVRDLIGERTIYERERSAGLSPWAYLRSKLVVFVCASAIQSAILVGIVLMGKPSPGHGALFGSGSFELVIDVAMLAACSAILGLALSSLVKSSEQAMPLLVVLTMAQLVMCGGLIPVTGRAGLSQIAVFFPARWGFAAGASTVDLRGLVPIAEPDTLWNHNIGHWMLAMIMLIIMSVGLAYLTYTRLLLEPSGLSLRLRNLWLTARPSRISSPGWGSLPIAGP